MYRRGEAMRLVFLLVFYAGYLTGSRLSHLDDVVFVSRVRGHAKMDSCGSWSLPCKSLQDGIDKLACGGQLYVDGEHSTVDPYTCESSGGKLTTERSLSIQSYTTPARISCRFGFHILANDVSTRMDVNITGVQFKNSVLYLRNANITIHGCTFLESSPAIDIKNTKDLPLYSLNIKNSVFERNHGCIAFLQGDVDQTRSCSRINLKLKNVIFQENTAFRGDVAKGGLVFVKQQSCNCKDMSFFSIWENVTAIRNRGKEQIFEDSRHRKRMQSYLIKDDPTNHSSKESTKRDLILDSLFVVYTCSSNITLNQVTSDNNSDMRYLGLQCCHSNVRIYKSAFYRHVVSGPGGVVYIPKGEVIYVTIEDSNFSGNVGSIGGALQIDAGGSKKRVTLSLSNVRFLYCYGSVTGCTVSVGSITKYGVGKVFAVLHGVLFKQCHNSIKRGNARSQHGPLCLQATRLTYVIIRDSIFRINKNRKAAAVKIIHSPTVHNGSTFAVYIVRTQFVQNTCDTNKPTLGIFIENPTLVTKSRLTIIDSVFSRNKGKAISVDNIQDIKFLNLTCKYTKGLCYDFYIGKRKNLKNIPPGLNATFLIENSTFSNNYQCFMIKYVQPNFVDIQVRNVIVQENTRGVQAFFQFGSKRLQHLKITGRVLFERLYLISNMKEYGNIPQYLFSVVVPKFHEGNISFVFRQCVFKSNFHMNTKIELAIPDTLLFFQTPDDRFYANSSVSKCSKFPTYDYKNTFIFEEVIFENNTGPSFIAYIANGKTSFNQCLFKNNYSHKPKTGAYLFIQEGTASVEFRDTNFIQTRVKSTSFKAKPHGKYDSSLMRFVFARARGPLLFRNSSFVANDSSERVIPHFTIQTEGYFYIDNHTRLVCPVGSNMDLEDGSHLIHQDLYGCINITQLKFICKMCGVGKYSLERGSFQKMLRPITCQEFCPFGAKCTWNIHSRPNFWGYHTSTRPPKLNFARCPENYCRVPRSKTSTSVYNRCSGNRTGVMCGACKEGFTESIFNHKCRPINECRDGWFWAIAALYSVIIAWYLLCRPPIVFCLINNLLWFSRQKTSTSNRRQEQTTTTGEHGRHGYSKIIFYFYQVADLLMLDSFSEILHKHVFISIVISVYNFKLELADSSLGCPFPGLTAVTKELFCCLQVFGVMVFLVMFYFLHWLIWAIRKRPRPLFAPYLAAIIEVLLLGYERLGQTSLKLLNCTPLSIQGRNEWRLELDGNITCWVHWWQYAMIAYNIVFVIPFMLVLLAGTSKLQRQEISSWHFVAACFVPLPFLMYWLLRRCLRRYREYGKRTREQSNGAQERRKALLDVLQGPFRSPDNQSRGACYWESILIGRRLVLLCLYTFISTPMLRMLFMSAVCITILVHNIIIRPYKDNKAHILGVALLSLHVALAMINLCKSVLITVGVNPKGPTKAQTHGLQMFEVALLGALPFIFLLLVLATLLSKLVQVLILVFRYLMKKCAKEDERILDINSRRDDCYRPLLSPNEQESLPYGEAQDVDGIKH